MHAEISGVNRTTQCQILSTCSSKKKSPSKPPLTKIHTKKRRTWSVQYLKQDFNLVIITDKMWATLYGPGGWSRGWVAHGRTAPTRFKQQQSGDGVMIWAGIIGNELVGPFKVEDGVKIGSAGYTQLLEKNLMPWMKKKSAALKKKMVFVLPNSPENG